eukprot:511373_1
MRRHNHNGSQRPSQAHPPPQHRYQQPQLQPPHRNGGRPPFRSMTLDERQNLMNRLSTSIPPQMQAIQAHRPPKPQPQRSWSTPISAQKPFMISQVQPQPHPQSCAHPLSFKVLRSKTSHKKRRLMDRIEDNNNNCHTRKRRKLSSTSNGASFVEECSFPYQALIDQHKWKMKIKMNSNPQRNTKMMGTKRKTERNMYTQAKDEQQRDYFHNLLVNVNHNEHRLQNSDKLIQKWDHILCSLCFEIIRNMAKNELCSNANSNLNLNSKELQAMVENKRNKYFAQMNELKIDYKAFGRTLLLRGADYWRNCSRLNSLFSFIACDAEECFVLNDAIRYNALSIKCEHKLYLWPDGFSYHTMDHLHPYDADTYHTKFIDFIDQCIVPSQWMNDIKRDSFNKKFFKEQQNMRLQRQQHAQSANKFNNTLDSFVSCKAIERLQNYEEIFKANSYFEGHLFLELIDFRYVFNSDTIDSYQYKQNCHLQRILLKSSALHLKESFADIPPFYAKHLKSKHFDILLRVYLMKQRKTFETLNTKYPFFSQYKLNMKQHYNDLVRRITTKQFEMQQLYQTYTSYKMGNTFTLKHNLNWNRHNKILKRLKASLIQYFYLSYDPLDPYQHRQYQTQYLHLKHNKMSLEKKEKENKTKNKNKEKEYLSMIQREQNRVIKLLSNAVITHEVERQILLKTHNNVCLLPSMEVMQVMNYAHYVRDQNLVRSAFNHKQIAQKMKRKSKSTTHYARDTNNVILDGINESQKFLHFIAQNANEKLFNMLQAMRNETKYLYDKGEENENDMKEPRKHPGQWIPKYSAKHYETKCCVLQKNGSKQKEIVIIILRIDLIKSKDKHKREAHNGLWLFTVTYETQCDSSVDYQTALNNFNANNVVYSQECLTLNSAAKLFYQHLRYEIYKNAAKLLFSQNTKFDTIVANTNNDDPNMFQIL